VKTPGWLNEIGVIMPSSAGLFGVVTVVVPIRLRAES
jgi:hypothetical protein